MKSTIRVKHDFTHNEPYLQIRIDGINDDDADLKDEHLLQLIEMSNTILYIPNDGSGKYLNQIRSLTHHTTTEASMLQVADAFSQFAYNYFHHTEKPYFDEFFCKLKNNIEGRMDKVEDAVNQKQNKESGVVVLLNEISDTKPAKIYLQELPPNAMTKAIKTASSRGIDLNEDVVCIKEAIVLAIGDFELIPVSERNFWNKVIEKYIHWQNI